MAKKVWKPTPESELTEEEVRKWFNNLRVLYQGSLHRIHEMKLERKKLNAKICSLQHENAALRRKERQWGIRKPTKPESDFKKKFFDSL